MARTRALVVMGVSGCGKSSLGAAVAAAEGVVLVEGDDFHSPESVAKMRRGVALDDADRGGWLDRLAAELRARPDGLVLTCSALKRAYRDRLRAASPGLRFAFLDLTRDEALRRVRARAAEHFFPARLVDNQFDVLEPPTAEPGVLRLDATEPPDALCRQVVAWLQVEPGDPGDRGAGRTVVE